MAESNTFLSFVLATSRMKGKKQFQSFRTCNFDKREQKNFSNFLQKKKKTEETKKLLVCLCCNAFLPPSLISLFLSATNVSFTERCSLCGIPFPLQSSQVKALQFETLSMLFISVPLAGCNSIKFNA